MNGITSMLAAVTIPVSTNARTYGGCSNNPKSSGSTWMSGDGCLRRCPVSVGTMRSATAQISAESAASRKNGHSQPKVAPKAMPTGTPNTAASENEVMTMPVAAPRRDCGITSLTTAITIEPSTPAVSPAKARASCSVKKVGASAHARLDSAKRTYTTSSSFLRSKRSMYVAANRPDSPAHHA